MTETSTPRIAVIAGATGLIGSQLLRMLIQSGRWGKIIVLTRRPLPAQAQHPLTDNRVIDFSQLDQLHIESDIPVQDCFCCLGTTLKQAGSKAAFYEVDYTYCMALAQWARQQSVAHFLLVSAVSAKADSMIWYNAVKGRLEADLQKMCWPQLTVVKPSLLLGVRPEPRFLEHLAIRLAPLLSPVFCGPLRRSHPVAAEAVASALLMAALQPGSEPVRSLYYEEIVKLAKAGAQILV